MAVRVLIVDTRPQRSRKLEQSLREAGFEVVAVIDGEDALHDKVCELAPDAVVVDTDSPGRDTLEHLASLGQRYPKPMIMLSESVDPELTLDAARAGVTAYAVETLSAPVVRSLVDVAIAHFRSHALLRTELVKVQRSLESRKLIDRAKCRLMERYGIGEEAAYQRLRKLAMDRRLNLNDLAREILSTGAVD
ncbi:response regulator [Alkalilimnicola ehrlichii]|uniref:Response regulator n=1 Tax=Alkalilimnicola ehrlichii TaxID=351052 RepID=A0A3E0X203_9GAMM|nr:ANTAR domain-containing protein [Alkalilimnicola ehrlichii]RFA30838.1 response regulator [Alkalilimnicola ehrlichii]RFA38352.1 response regulator [Alkalilimnicola ehrlichii]